MLTNIIRGKNFNVEKISNIEIVKRIVTFSQPKYKYKLTYKYYEPRNSVIVLPLITANIGFLSIGCTTIDLDNIYSTYYVLKESYEDAEKLKKEIENKQLFMKLKRDRETLELAVEYRSFMK
jgi:hypothetical protein